MLDIEDVMRSFCNAGTSAMRRYAQASGEAPDDLPEYFLSSYIFDRLGDDLAATLETRFSKLSEWNDDIRKARQLPLRSTSDQKNNLLTLAEAIGRPLVDMAIFDKENSDDPGDWRFLALVEFKKGEFSRDREKLLRILSHIDTCPYGITCGSVRGEANLEFHRREASDAKDRWYPHEIGPLSADYRRYFSCARLFENPAAI